jgi:hypothetical protein
VFTVALSTSALFRIPHIDVHRQASPPVPIELPRLKQVFLQYKYRKSMFRCVRLQRPK